MSISNREVRRPNEVWRLTGFQRRMEMRRVIDADDRGCRATTLPWPVSPPQRRRQRLDVGDCAELVMVAPVEEPDAGWLIGVITGFVLMEQMKGWRDSPEYTAAHKDGEKYAKFNVVAVNGVP
jgi:hypothetical protein